MLCGKPVFSLVNCFSETLRMQRNTARSGRHTSYGTSFNSVGIWEKNNLINTVFFCFSWLHWPIDEDSPPGCLLLLCKYSPFQLRPLVLLLLKLSFCFGFFLLGILGRFFAEYKGEGWEQNFIMAPYARRIVKHICMEVLQHHPDRALVPEIVFNFQAPPKKERTNHSVPTVPSNKTFDFLRRETEAVFWLQNSENHLNRSYLNRHVS